MSASAIEARIRRMLQGGVPRVFAAVHVRHHWALGVFQQHSGRLTARILDSAPSLVTRLDIVKLMRRLHVDDVEVSSPARQPRASNECGVHAIVNAWRAHLDLPAKIGEETLDLSHLRPVLHHLSHTRDQELARRIAGNPEHRHATSRDPPPSVVIAPSRRADLPSYRDPPARPDMHSAAGPAVTAHAPQIPSPTTAVSGGARTEAPPATTAAQLVDAPRRARRQHDPYATVEVSDFAVARENLCYLLAAFQLLHALQPEACAVPTAMSRLRQVQRDLGYPAQTQQCAIEAMQRIAGDRVAFVFAVRGGFSRLVDESVTATLPNTPLVLVTTPGVDARIPASHEVVGCVLFQGQLERAQAHDGGQHLHAERGHLVFRSAPSGDPSEHVVAYSLRPVRASNTSPPVAPRVLDAPRPAAAPVTDSSIHRLDGLMSKNGTHVVVRYRDGPNGPVRQASGILRPCKVALRHRVIDLDVARGRSVALRFGPSESHELIHVRRQEPGESPTVFTPEPQRHVAPQPHHATRHPDAAQLAPAQSVREQRPAAARVEAPMIQQTRPPSPIGRTELRRRLNTLSVGTRVRMHWTRRTDAGEWLGSVISNGRIATVSFDAAVCPDCRLIRGMEQIVLEVPSAQTLYYAFEAYDPAPDAEPCVCTDADDDASEADDGNAVRRDDFVIERQPNAQLGVSDDRLRMTGNTARHWFVFRDRPPHVHNLTWRQLAQTTRRQHIMWLDAIRGMPADLAFASLDAACVELVLRRAEARKWKWSTVASALSAVASALSHLPLYTNNERPIDIKTSPYYAGAMRRAQHLARVSVRTELSTPMTFDTYRQLVGLATGGRTIKHDIGACLLLETAWHFAARVGDMRQVCPCDVVLVDRDNGEAGATVTFRYGKGASWWGPYTIHAVIPGDLAKRLTARTKKLPADQPIFASRDQAALSACVAACDLTLRSIRRGALTHAAACGVPDHELQLLSGHKRMDTLLRYLGWGKLSSTAQHAAVARNAREQVRGAGADADIVPPKMGLHSGRAGLHGRRVAPPPQLCPMHAPSEKDLGLESPHDVSSYVMLLKRPGLIDRDALQRLAADSSHGALLPNAFAWYRSPTYYGPPRTVDPRSIPYARFTEDQARALLAADKISPHIGPIRGFCKGFVVPQHAKRRLRPVFEPIINDTMQREMLLVSQYPSRFERRARARGARFSAELDFSSYFDQFELAPECLSWFVIRFSTPIDGHSLFALTRMPMGASFAPGVAQLITWIIVSPLLCMHGVRVDTMIDNIRVVADTAPAFITALRLTLERIQIARLTLNDADDWARDDTTVLQRCAIAPGVPRVFLGEQYVCDTVANSPTNVDKFARAIALYERSRGDLSATYTLRHFASLLGLIVFMGHTVNQALCDSFVLLRAWGAMVSEAAGWDVPCAVTSDAVHAELMRLAAVLVANGSVPLPQLRPPPFDAAAYDACAIVDASNSGWGAHVHFPRSHEVYTLRQRWTTRMEHSAHAEPRAATLCVQWIRRRLPGAFVALVTDHCAIAHGQRRWYSANGGFSSSYRLYEFFRTLYGEGGGEVFFVDGDLNSADGPSRDPTATLELTAVRADSAFPALTSFHHPHALIPRLTHYV
jgi:hypothetical protein